MSYLKGMCILDNCLLNYSITSLTVILIPLKSEKNQPKTFQTHLYDKCSQTESHYCSNSNCAASQTAIYDPCDDCTKWEDKFDDLYHQLRRVKISCDNLKAENDYVINANYAMIQLNNVSACDNHTRSQTNSSTLKVATSTLPTASSNCCQHEADCELRITRLY